MLERYDDLNKLPVYNVIYQEFVPHLEEAYRLGIKRAIKFFNLKMIKIQRFKNQYTITIPKEIAQQVKLKSGEEVTIVPDQYDKDIIIKRRR